MPSPCATSSAGIAPLGSLDLLEEVAEIILKQASSFDAEVAAVGLASLSFSNPGIPQHVGILQSLGQCCDLVACDLEVHGVIPVDFFNIGHFGARVGSSVTLSQLVHFDGCQGGNTRGSRCSQPCGCRPSRSSCG